MGWFGWFKRGNGSGDARIEAWRRAWREALDTPDAERLDALREQLDALASRHPAAERPGRIGDDELEIEREMLDGFEALVALSRQVAESGPPTIVTGHRAVGSDPCFFSAPASLPDDPAQPSGTLLITSSRAIFVGGARALAIPWHSVAECTPHDRDLLLVRLDRQELQRLRCNTFSDTLRAAFLARHLSRRRV